MTVNPSAQRSLPRVFVVEDEALIAMELLDCLVELGYEPCGHAANSEQALQGIAQTCPDAVLMDVHLGAGADGIDTTRQLQRSHDIPVVFLTAYCDAALIARAAEVNAFGYVLKPFNDRAVKAALAMAIARHATALQLRQTHAAHAADFSRSLGHGGILPICMECKKVRDGEQQWHQLEAFLSAHTHAQFSHGYCPSCERQVRLALGFDLPAEGQRS